MEPLEREEEILKGYRNTIDSVWSLLYKLLDDLEKVKSEIKPIEYGTAPNSLHLIFTRAWVEEVVKIVKEEVKKVTEHECLVEAVREMSNLSVKFRSNKI
jgi:hypothetical protein